MAFCARRSGPGMDAHGAVPVLFPHVCGFRLHMCVLMQRAFPLPVWWALQIRNRLVRYRYAEAGESFDLETQLGGHRFVDKGVEVELHTRLMRASDCYWESRVTYFYRGRFGDRDETGTRFGLSLEGDPRAALAGVWRPGAESIDILKMAGPRGSGPHSAETLSRA
ncbi:MAG: hypothetical protein ABI790_18840 [Betaproteobacteria bacterium]